MTNMGSFLENGIYLVAIIVRDYRMNGLMFLFIERISRIHLFSLAYLAKINMKHLLGSLTSNSKIIHDTKLFVHDMLHLL